MDAKEFKQRFLPHHRMLYHVAYRLTGNVQDAEDLLQDTYLRLWQKRESLSKEATQEVFLVSVMRHLHIEQRRLMSHTMLTTVEQLPDRPDERSLSSTMEAGDQWQYIDRLLDNMPEREREVFRRHFVNDQSYADIERDTGLTQANARQIISRTKQKLKAIITRTWTK